MWLHALSSQGFWDVLTCCEGLLHCCFRFLYPEDLTYTSGVEESTHTHTDTHPSLTLQPNPKPNLHHPSGSTWSTNSRGTSLRGWARDGVIKLKQGCLVLVSEFYLSIYLSIYLCIYLSIYLSIYTHTLTHIYIYICTYAYMHIYVHGTSWA